MRTAAPQVAGVWLISLVDKPALRCQFKSQSCLCPTPELRSFHMGIALTTFSALSNPVRTLSRWLQSTHPLPAPAGSDSEQIHLPLAVQSRLGEVKAATPSRPAPPPGSGPGFGISRPVRGNWPFTVNPPPPSAEHDTHAPPGKVSDPSPSVSRGAHNTGRFRSRGSCFAHTTEQGIRFQRDAGRMVIAGRMADVCAELDRMAACEAGLRTH